MKVLGLKVLHEWYFVVYDRGNCIFGVASNNSQQPVTKAFLYLDWSRSIFVYIPVSYYSDTSWLSCASCYWPHHSCAYCCWPHQSFTDQRSVGLGRPCVKGGKMPDSLAGDLWVNRLLGYKSTRVHVKQMSSFPFKGALYGSEKCNCLWINQDAL